MKNMNNYETIWKYYEKIRANIDIWKNQEIVYDQRVPNGAPTKFTFNGVSLLAAYMLLENNFYKLTRNTNNIDISFVCCFCLFGI